jgi:hypothetical protein
METLRVQRRQLCPNSGCRPGWYSNKKRGLRTKKRPKAQEAPGIDEPDTPYRRKLRITWAALIKRILKSIR